MDILYNPIKVPKNSKEWRELLGRNMRITLEYTFGEKSYYGILNGVVGRNIQIDNDWLWRRQITKVELIELKEGQK